jgi:hypothetical protein
MTQLTKLQKERAAFESKKLASFRIRVNRVRQAKSG